MLNSDAIIVDNQRPSSSILELQPRISNSIEIETYFCNICHANHRISKGFVLRSCSHRFCDEYVKNYIENRVNRGQLIIRCFHPLRKKSSCRQIIEEEDLFQIISAESWKKYQRFKANGNRLLRQCPYCSHVQIGNDNNPITTCLNAYCGKLYCLYHGDAHSAVTKCEKYELSITTEARMNEMTKISDDETKPCPKCNLAFYKNGGCNHLKCTSCNCSFCWLCSKVIENATRPQHFEHGKCEGQQFDSVALQFGLFEYMSCRRTMKWLFLVLTAPVRLLFEIFVCCLQMLGGCDDRREVLQCLCHPFICVIFILVIVLTLVGCLA